MAPRLVLTSVLATTAICQDVRTEKKYAKGFVRQPRNEAVPVGTITPEMRAAAPARLDWTETSGAVNIVKGQGDCGSCWAFSAVAGIEAAVFQATGSSVSLSEQQVVSCDTTDQGCFGGDLPTAFDYIEDVGGLDTEDAYPYTSGAHGHTGSCKDPKTPVVQVTDYKYAVPPCEGLGAGHCHDQDEDGLKAVLATHGPLSICVDAEDWGTYSGDIFPSGCSDNYYDVDHCLLLVGYDTTASTPYWKVKNSWGTDWGEDGFIRLPFGENACGLANEAMYVTVSSASVV